MNLKCCRSNIFSHTMKNIAKELLTMNKRGRRLNKRSNIALVFDDDKRRKFLGGFHKRKLQRQKKAQEELQRQLKEEKKRIKQDARKRYKKLLSHQDLPEFEKLFSKQEFETEEHKVSILEMDLDSLYEKDKCIGINKAKADENKKNLTNNIELVTDTSIKIIENETIESPKDLKRAMKQATLKEVKKSKAFQQKHRLEHYKNKRQNIKKRKMQQKILKKLKGKFKRKIKR